MPLRGRACSFLPVALGLLVSCGDDGATVGGSSSGTSSATAQMLATIFQPKATMITGARNLVTAAPTLPAPKMPSAVPCFSFGYHVDT